MMFFFAYFQAVQCQLFLDALSLGLFCSLPRKLLSPFLFNHMLMP
jgi:hypothetical protein